MSDADDDKDYTCIVVGCEAPGATEDREDYQVVRKLRRAGYYVALYTTMEQDTVPHFCTYSACVPSFMPWSFIVSHILRLRNKEQMIFIAASKAQLDEARSYGVPCAEMKRARDGLTWEDIPHVPRSMALHPHPLLCRAARLCGCI